MTSPLPTLALTGSTGQLGSLIAADLASRGLLQRVLVRELSRAPKLAGAVAVAIDFSDRETTAKALAGVRTLFFVSLPESDDRVAQHCRFIDAAAAASVEHIVYTSFVGASDDAVFTLARDHAATEAHIRSSGMHWTFLRDSFYADFLALLAGEDGVIRGPAGDGRVGAVARADVARSAAAVLAAPDKHIDRSYDMTGPEALTLAEVAAIVGEATGRSITFHDETVDEAYASRRGHGVPDWQLDAWVSTYTAIRAGELAVVSDAVEQLTGRRPLSLRELLSKSVVIDDVHAQDSLH